MRRCHLHPPNWVFPHEHSLFARPPTLACLRCHELRRGKRCPENYGLVRARAANPRLAEARASTVGERGRLSKMCEWQTPLRPFLTTTLVAVGSDPLLAEFSKIVILPIAMS
jgi:hypothetical protein